MKSATITTPHAHGVNAGDVIAWQGKSYSVISVQGTTVSVKQMTLWQRITWRIRGFWRRVWTR